MNIEQPFGPFYLLRRGAFMLRLGYCCLLSLVLSATGAMAGGYDDFASGLSAVNRGDSDQAIAFLTSALAAGDLNANLVPVAYLERARAHFEKDDCAAAVADAGAALKMKPVYFEALLLRANAERCAGNDADAIADFAAVIAIRPVDEAYWQRAFARWNLGDFQNAADDFSTAASKSPEWAYPVIWFGLSKLRAGTFDGVDFAKRHHSFDSSEWPAPVFGLFESHIKPDDVVQTAGKSDEKTVKDNLCEAHFYVAEWWLVQNNIAAAKPLLENVRDTCRHDFVEYKEALVELRRLK
jgi:lipoprotein NlpI